MAGDVSFKTRQVELEQERLKLREAQNELRKARERAEYLKKQRELEDELASQEAHLRTAMTQRLALEEQELRQILLQTLTREEAELRVALEARLAKEEEEGRQALGLRLTTDQNRRGLPGNPPNIQEDVLEQLAPTVEPQTRQVTPEESPEADESDTDNHAESEGLAATSISPEVVPDRQVNSQDLLVASNRGAKQSAQLLQFLIHLDEEIRHMDSAVGQNKHSELLGACRWIGRYASVLGLTDLVKLAGELSSADVANDPTQVLKRVDELRKFVGEINQQLERPGEEASASPLKGVPSMTAEAAIVVPGAVMSDHAMSVDIEMEESQPAPPPVSLSLQPQRAQFLDMMPRQLTYLEEAWFERDEVEFRRICVWIMRHASMLEFSAIREVAEKVAELDWRTQASQVNFQLRYLENIFDNTSLPARHILRSSALKPGDRDDYKTNISSLEVMVALRREQEKAKAEPPTMFDAPTEDPELFTDGPGPAES